MKRSTLVAISTVAGVAGVLGFNPKGVDPNSMSMVGTDTTTTPNSSTDMTTAPKATTTQSATPSPAQISSSANGTIAGQTIQTHWGPVQLSATFSNGQITAIDALQYPSKDGRSLQISRYSIPILNQQALSAQSANIQGVSGATFTSLGYQQSLQSILDQI